VCRAGYLVLWIVPHPKDSARKADLICQYPYQGQFRQASLRNIFRFIEGPKPMQNAYLIAWAKGNLNGLGRSDS